MKFVHFTAPDGASVPVNPAQVADIRAPEPGVYDARGRAVIVLTNGYQVVRETPAEVEQKLQEA